jgi:hypothetical protein
MATQPGTGLAVFDPKVAVPAHIAQAFEAEGTNIQPRTTVPSLSPEGKTWTIAIEGQKHKMQRRNADGDLEPLPIMKAIVLDYAKQRGRPITRASTTPTTSARRSAGRTTASRRTTACRARTPRSRCRPQDRPGHVAQDQREVRQLPDGGQGLQGHPRHQQGGHGLRAAPHARVLPDPAMGLPETLQKPLRLKIAMTSDWDKESPQEEAAGLAVVVALRRLDPRAAASTPRRSSPR